MIFIKTRLISIYLLLFFPFIGIAQGSFVYVSEQNSNIISVFKCNASDGKLTKVEDTNVSGGPASIAVSSDKKFMYVSQRTAKTFSSFSINSSTGQLSFIGSINAVDNPVNISTDKTGKYLLSAYFAASKAAIYSINPVTGVINSTPVLEFSTAGINPHAIKTDPENRFLYLTNMTGNLIQQFSFDGETGEISPLIPSVFTPINTDGPRHFVFHGEMNILYVSNELSNTVSVYRYNVTTGLLENLQTISTLPANYNLTNKVADVHITPDNKYLFASNRGHDSLAGFIIDSISGLLTANGYYSTQTSPRAFDIDASGNYLYAAGETSGKMTAYKIDRLTGQLDSIDTYSVGLNPSWIKCLDFSTTATSGIENKIKSLYPNPTENGVFVNASGVLSIFSIAGQKLLNQEINGNAYLPLSGLNTGIYVVSIENSEGRFEQDRLIIK